MKFFKVFFSRFLIIALAIIFQLFIYLTTNIYLSETYIWIYHFFVVIGIIIFIAIINKNKPASFKLPWIVLILLFPIVGVTLYFTFGNLSINRRLKKHFFNNPDLTLIDSKNDEVLNQLKNEDLEAFGQAKYIELTTKLPLYKNSFINYLPTGELLFEKLINEMKKAEKYIFLEYFIIREGLLWNRIHQILIEKVNKNVEVYLMYDDVGSISTIPGDFIYKLRNEGINACKFNPFKPIVSVVHNNRDHRKIAVIDGKVGFVSGANIGDEYINITHPYGEWKDNAVMLKGESVNSLVCMFIQMYNVHSIKKLIIDNYINNDYHIYSQKGYVLPYGDGPSPIYNDYIGKNVYLNIIRQAKKYLYITTPYLIVDYEFLEAIEVAAKRGVDVRIITPQIPDKKIIKIMTKSNYPQLIKAGVKVYEYKEGFIHAKTFVCDNKYATVGTINLDYRSLVHHFECGVWMYGCSCIKDIKNDILNIIEKQSILMNEKNIKMNYFERLIKNLLLLIAPLM